VVTVKAAGDAAGRSTVTLRLGKQQTATIGVTVAKPGELWPYFNNIGISSDTDTSAAYFDGGGWSYSAQALAAAGATPGGTVSADGIDYTWPDVPVATPDNIEAAGQTISLKAPPGATRIGLLGSASTATSAGAGGTATVTYSDGTTSQFSAMLSDWALGGQTWGALPGNFTALSAAYRNFTGNQRSDIKVFVFALDAALTTGKTPASITLPKATGGVMHVFAIGFA
jgi:hypothetical protein